MFTLSFQKLSKYGCAKLLSKEYFILSKLLRDCGKQNSVLFGNSGKELSSDVSAYRKISFGHYRNKNVKSRCFSSKLENNLLVKPDEKSEVDKETLAEIPSKEIVKQNSLCDDDEENLDFYKVDEEAVTNGDPDLLKKLKLCMLEIDTFRQEGYEVPTRLKTDEWKDIIACRSRSAKLKQLRFLFLNEVRKQNDKIRKEKRREKRLEELEKLIESQNPDHIRYGIGGSTIFLRIHETTMNMLSNNRLILAMKFGQNVVVDCSYDSYMSKQEMKNCAKQLMMLFAHNRSHDDPFNINFTSINPESVTIKSLKKYIPTMYDIDFPMNTTEKSYLELFPKDRLVYLTPHCRNDLTTFSHDDIYIIGALVDKKNSEPLSLAKAKSEGLRMARFPIDRYLSWQMGTKSLTLDQCINILLEVKKSGDWEKAFQFVPRRKLNQNEGNFEMNEEEEAERDKSMKFGQSYVTTHEWGLNKNQRPRKKTQNYDFDLRSVVATYKKGKKGRS